MNKYLSFIEKLKTEKNLNLLESIIDGFETMFESKETYELKTKGGGKTTTTMPPSKRTLDNLPEYADGKSRVKFQDWLEMDPVTHSTGKGCDGKWYGWSHRAVYGFGIGDKVKKGDSGYKGKEYTIETEAQAKKAAEDFAESVS